MLTGTEGPRLKTFCDNMAIRSTRKRPEDEYTWQQPMPGAFPLGRVAGVKCQIQLCLRDAARKLYIGTAAAKQWVDRCRNQESVT